MAEVLNCPRDMVWETSFQGDPRKQMDWGNSGLDRKRVSKINQDSRTQRASTTDSSPQAHVLFSFFRVS